MKKIIFFAAACFMLLSSCAELQQVLNTQGIGTGLSEQEVITGLKEALNKGLDTSVSRLARTDGYLRDQAVKLLLPPESQKLFDLISKIPGGNQKIELAITAINRAAEDAAPAAKQIFINAVSNISINDAWKILKGNDTAATAFLQSRTYNQLVNEFAPPIKASLSKPLVASVSAESAYSLLINDYNKASLNGMLWAP